MLWNDLTCLLMESKKTNKHRSQNVELIFESLRFVSSWSQKIWSTGLIYLLWHRAHCSTYVPWTCVLLLPFRTSVSLLWRCVWITRRTPVALQNLTTVTVHLICLCLSHSDERKLPGVREPPQRFPPPGFNSLALHRSGEASRLPTSMTFGVCVGTQNLIKV